MNIKTIGKFVICILLGIIIGVSSAYLTVQQVSEMFSVSNGPWKINLLAGSERADIYSRAAIALYGLFALNKSEAVYFIAKTDSNFNPLRLECDYRVEGKNLPARWWSITVYGSDLFLIPNELNRYSLTSANVKKDGERWTIYLSKEPKEGNWIPLNGEGQFYLLLRLYNPEEVVYQHPESIDLPEIVLEGCS